MSRVTIAIAVLSAGLAAASGAPGAATAGGLFGVVTRGPTTPVCTAGQPCTKPAAAAVLTFSRRGAAVARATVRGDGSYRIRLPAGLYVVRASSGRLEPPSVRVRSGTPRRVDFSIDTGIR